MVGAMQSTKRRSTTRDQCTAATDVGGGEHMLVR